MAADHQRLEVIDQLIAAGTPVDATDEAFGGHPLRTAAGNGRPASVRRLLAPSPGPSRPADNWVPASNEGLAWRARVPEVQPRPSSRRRAWTMAASKPSSPTSTHGTPAAPHSPPQLPAPPSNPGGGLTELYP
jgi:hypothetical protein